MHHLHIRIGRRRYLLCDPQTTSTGRPTGYGNLIRHIEQTIRAASSLGASVFLIQPVRSLNPALYALESADVRIVAQSGWRAPLLRGLWRVSAPLRYGKPLAWARSMSALALRPAIERAKHWSRRRGWRALDRRLDTLGHRCRRATGAYEDHVAAAWSRLYAEARERAKAADAKPRFRLRLPAGANQAAERLARDAGVDLASPMVTLHVREAGYRTRGAERQRDLDDIRDASIAAYEPAVASLVARGYQVVRIGDASMTPCPWPGVIDLATAPWRTGAFELWALLRSRFFIASDSGPYYLSKLCDVPCLAVNVIQVGYYTGGDRDRYICKHVYDRTSGRRLAVAEMLTDEFISTALDANRYEWLENEPVDIVEAVEDLIALLDHPGTPRTPAQRRHDALLAAVSSRPRAAGRSRTSLLFRRQSRGTISPRFAAKYL